MNGILLVDKPRGITSHDVVAKVRKVFGMKAVGHAGTLDPMAQGLLIILLGEATKFSNYIMGQDKKYSAEVRLGLATDSWDAEGELLGDLETLKTQKIDFSEEQICSQIQKLQGALRFKVPVHSAVKVNGKKLYDYARKGQEIEVPMRTMVFYKAELKKSDYNSFFLQGEDFTTPVIEVDLECEKGAYIRSWVHHFGEELGCGALMSGLVRHSSGEFKLQDAVKYSDLLDLDQMSLRHKVIELQKCFKGAFYRATMNEAKLLRNGQIPHELNLRMIPRLKTCQSQGKVELVRVFNSDLSQMLAVLELPPQGKPKIIRALQN